MSRTGVVHVLVDAHNVLHQDPTLRPLMNEPERARAELEQLLAGRTHLHLFYDGGPGGEVRTSHRQGLAVDYAGTGEADNRIVHWLQTNHSRRAIVVTDDAELRRRVRTLGAGVQDARGFLDGLRRDRDPRENRGPLSPGEVDEWMRIFGLDQDPQP
ncbi:MAG TPA: NYN domain-containing protein [Planctomycetota bacterium]|nr:NYN domain-containing protein [Planctomycetota bacterium]